MHSPWHVEQQAALRAVRRASKMCRGVQQAMRSDIAMQKADRSPVTIADFASQAIICALLHETLPNDPIVGEEGTAQLRMGDQSALRKLMVERVSQGMGKPVSEEQALKWIDMGTAEPLKIPAGANGRRFWTLDPIDGTKGFLRGDQYAVALALIEDGKVVVGVLGCPNLAINGIRGVLVHAARGQGAFVTPLDGPDSDGPEAGAPIHAQTLADASHATILEPVEAAHADAVSAAKVASILHITGTPMKMDSMAKYAALAAGQVSIYLRLPKTAEYHENIWDHAAGVIVLEEAGGKVTDVSGKALDFSKGKTLLANRGIIGTCGSIHGAVIEAVKQTVGG